MVVVRGEQSSSTQLQGQVVVGLSWAELERVWRQFYWSCLFCHHVPSSLLLPLEGPKGVERL